MIFSRLRVRSKMNLLILLPLIALLFVAVPFVAVEVNSARAAAATADAAHSAQTLSNLIWQLQRERLLTAAFLVSPDDDGTRLRQQHDVAAAAAAAVSTGLGSSASDELAGAMTRVGSLTELREAALHRGTSLDSVARAYHAVIQALIDALRLVPQRTSDAEGTRQLTALDALLNANEQSALRGMALIAAAVAPQTGLTLLNDATSRAQQFIESFVEQANLEEADQVVQVELGEAAHQVDAAVRRLPDVHGARAIADFAAQALTAVDTQAQLRRTVQDRVTGEIADAAGGRATGARNTALAVGAGTGLLFVVVAALTVTLSRSIARPLRQLTTAAGEVANLAGSELARVGDAEDIEQEQVPRLAEIEVASADEVGELAEAFNRLQSSASHLVERQIISRRNVSLMFTNVAQRTRNLVSRQLAVVDELERDEQNAPLLARLYHLDHLATRLRRTAENLLVLAGSQEEARIKRPTSLATLLRAALTEIEDYQRVRFHTVTEVVIGPESASDLMLIFAEVLENATSFSPPESTVDVMTDLSTNGGHCRVSVVDHGIGMKAQRLLEENQRLVERERLDIAPTNVLGLFVVGRLARRHGLTVRLRQTAGGGTTVDVVIPAMLFHSRPMPDVIIPAASGRHAAAAVRRPAIAVAVSALPATSDGFDWFSRQAIGPAPARANGVPVPAAVGPQRSAVAYAAPAPSPVMGMDSPAVMGMGPPVMGPPAVTGMSPPALSRRVPGAHLAPGLKDRPAPRPSAPPTSWRPRDPDGERANFDSYTAAWGRAGVTADRQPDPPEYASGR